MTTGARADLVRVLVAHAGRGLGGRLPRPGVCRLGGIQLLQPNLELPPFPNDGRLALEELRPDLGKEQEVDISAGNEFLWAAELVHAPGALLSLQLGLESAALKNADLQHSPYRLPCDHRADGLHHAGGANAVNVNEAEFPPHLPPPPPMLTRPSSDTDTFRPAHAACAAPPSSSSSSSSQHAAGCLPRRTPCS
eukprot:scaffold2495_cov101-Isochrysis_galbana.AAC.17